jgi:hypothetical protein
MPLFSSLVFATLTANVGVRAFVKWRLVYDKMKCTVSLLAVAEIAGNMPLGFSSQDRLRTRNRESGPQGPDFRVSGVRCQGKNKKLKPVEDPVCSEAAAGNTET